MNDDPFLVHRPLLFTIAYELLGSAVDAEDVVQECWLRWADIDHTRVSEPRAYLVRTVSRQALNRLRAVARRREVYIGPWLPEPLLTTPDVADDVELAESVSLALLVVLETLGPTERAVFVLREVFHLPFVEIAEAIGKPVATARQIAHRARTHVAARQPRIPVSRSEHEAVVEQFLAALRSGRVDQLMAVLAADVVLVADGGGSAAATPIPISGAELVAKLLARPNRKVSLMWLNGSAAIRIESHRQPAVVSMIVEQGRITRIFAIANPDKLTRLNEPAQLAR
jgi:RNA polymerase sigma factor (sigma-70 family)